MHVICLSGQGYLDAVPHELHRIVDSFLLMTSSSRKNEKFTAISKKGIKINYTVRQCTLYMASPCVVISVDACGFKL